MFVACPMCNERGCRHCDNEGHFKITDCPQKQFDQELLQFLDLADLFEKGVTPITGGALDQSSWFLNGVKFLRSEENIVESETLKNG